MRVETLFDILDSDFYTGVPDSQLQALCNFLIDKYGISEHHVIAANEGNCTALAAGHYLATGNVPVVYMQNSGIGNIMIRFMQSLVFLWLAGGESLVFMMSHSISIRVK